MRQIRIIVVDDAKRDVSTVRQVWRRRSVELLGPFPAELMTGEALRRSDGVLIAIDTDIAGLQKLVDLLRTERVPFLFTARSTVASHTHFSLDTDIEAIDALLEALVMQDDDGLRH